MKDLKFPCVFFGTMMLASLVLAKTDPNLYRPEPNAFLNRPASSIQEVIKQVRTDPEVYDRFAKYYGMSKAELVDYFSTLKQAKLPKNELYVVYNVHEDGVIRSRLFDLKAGSLVYVDSFGQAVMKKVCGNPMKKGPSNLSTAALVPETPTSAMAEYRPITETPEVQMPIEMMVVEEVVMPAFVAEQPPVTPPTIVTPETPVVKPSFESIPIASILPLLAGAAVLAPGGNNAPIPEPATVVAITAMIGLYGASRARRRAK